MKKMARKTKAASPSDSDYSPSDHDQDKSAEGEEVHLEGSPSGDTPPHSPSLEVLVNDSVPTPSSSPSHTTTPISIAPLPPPASSQPTSTAPLPPPIFTQTTLTTTTSTPEPPRHLKDLNEKLDKLLASSSSSSSTSTYSDAAIKALIETSIKQHDESIQKATEAVDASARSCQKATKEVASLISDAKIFLEYLQGAVETNTNKVNNAIESLSKCLQAEKENFDSVRSSLQANQTTLLSSINNLLDKLQADLAMENKIMDELARKTTLLEVESIQLNQANKEIDSLKTERVVIKSCISDVFAILSNLVNAHDSILTLSV
ncbi:uncharacterized protein At4g04980-like [Lactuca sativa]|uniref:uncharacterized protein At4g04980-like n=1 Tax=Lactuca sativa TaxID=4236 RepID=UPI000CD9E9E7|nr:uncharacterized protein At4g04980-like [Lactuca sativa]